MNEKIELTKRWIEKGDHDLGTAIITFNHLPKYFDIIAFHCQQAVEKYLKSYLIFLGFGNKRTHDLIYLLELLNEKIPIARKWYGKASVLTDFAVEIRYPDQIIKLSEEEIIEAINIAKEFRIMIIKKLNITYDFNI